jgi:hypothetical protein
MDFLKAFDKVSHSLLIHKLKHLRGKVNNWIESFLSGRTGPNLFLYYINDIPTGLYSTIRLFADDTIAYLVVKSNSDALTLQRDLDKLAVGDGFPPR